VGHQQTIEARQMDLLIVDDDNGFRRFVVRRLKRQGRSVRDANAPSAGIEFARKHSFEVAAIDSMLPEVNGIELLRKPKEIGAACEVAMLRGESSVESSIKHGVFDYVSKPSVRWNGYAHQSHITLRPLVHSNVVRRRTVRRWSRNKTF
jgi:DNA-binding NtrC family response regulator